MGDSKLLKNLINHLLEIPTPALMEDFLRGILTPKELAEISRRLEIVRQLKSSTPQHKIAENLGVGVATVTHGSKELQNNRFKFWPSA